MTVKDNWADGDHVTAAALNAASAAINANAEALTYKQPIDTELTALSTLTSAANKGIQFTGSGTAATYDLTAAGKALLDDADAAAQRVTLGVMSSAEVVTAVTTTKTDPTAVGWDIIPILGQSNALGRGAGISTDYFDVQDSRIQQFANLSSPYPDQVVIAKDPLFHQELPAATVGFALAFAKLYAMTIPVGRRVLLVPCARGNTGFASSGDYTWRVGETGATTNLYSAAVAQIGKALALPGSNRVAAVLWHQGEANASPGAGPTYRTDLLAVIDDLRTRYGSTVPIVLGQMSPAKIAADAGYAEIDTIHQSIPGLRNRIGMWLAAPLYNTGDTVHFSADGQRINGATAFKAYALALTTAGGVATRDTLPAPPVANLLAPGVTSTTVSLTWTAPFRVVKYLVRYRVGAGSFTNAPDVAAGATGTTVTGLSVSTAYEFQVAAVGVDATSAYTSVSKTTPAAVPPGFNDNFNAADGTLDFTTDGKPWTPTGIGGTPTWVRTSGAAKCNTAAGTQAFAVVEGLAADGTLTHVIRSTGAGHIGGTVMRYVDDNNHYYLAWRVSSGTNRYVLFKKVAGTGTELGRSASGVVSTDGDTVDVVMAAGAITVKVNGASVITVTGLTDFLTATKHGLMGGNVDFTGLTESIAFVP